MSQRRYAPSLLLFVALLVACGGGGGAGCKGCSCIAPIPGGFPVAQRHENAIQVRLSQSALGFLEQSGPGLVSSLLPGMMTSFALPTSCTGDPQLCCSNGIPGMCAIDIDIKGLKLAASPPRSLDFTVTTALKTKAPFPLKSTLLINATCMVAIDTAAGKQHQAVDLSSSLNFDVDPMTDLTSLSLANTKVTNLDNDMITITPQNPFWDAIGCGIANVAKALGVVQGALTTTLGTQLSGAVGGALCSKCMSQADCSSLADACTKGQCMRGKSCLQEVGVSGTLNLGSLFGSLAGGAKSNMDLIAVLGGYAEATQAPGGVSLGMLGGAMGHPHNECVPLRPSPAAVTVPRWVEEMGPAGEVEPVGMKPYHVGIGVHESELNQMAWGAFDGGALCLNVGTATVPQLDAATLGVLIPSLADLTHARNAPMTLVLRPQQEPHITLGNGTFNVDGMGKKSIKEPLLNVSIPGFAVDFYGWIDERFVRVMTLNADVTLGVSLDVDDKGQLVPMIGDLSKAFANVTVTNSELLSENPAELAKAFPTLLGAAAGALGSLKGVALPQVMGINLHLVGIEPTDNLKFLSIFATLDLAKPDAFHAQTIAEIAAVHTPPTEAFRVQNGLDSLVQPQVELALSGRGQGGTADDLEWSVSIDDGFWTPYSQARRYIATEPRLWLQGRHFVDVRARVVGEPATTDPQPVRLDFLVDTIAPSGSFDAAGDELLLDVADLVSPPGAIVYGYRLGEGAWSAWTAGDRITLPGASHLASSVEVRARDEAGNIGPVAFHGRTTAPPAAKGGCGCQLGASTNGPAPTGMIVFAVLALGGLLLRRKTILLQRSMVRIGAVAGAADRPFSEASRAPRTMVLLLGTVAALGAATGACSHDDSASNSGDGGATVDGGDVQSPALFEDPLNSVGRYSSSAAQGGVIYLAAYDDQMGDLAYAEVAVGAIAKTIQWQWVDGVPLDASVDNPGGPRNGITDPGDDVGQYTSIAVDAAGDPHIAYFDVTHGALKYASASKRKFTTSFVDMPAAKSGRAGLYTSISLDAGGVPSIAYASTAIPDGKGGYAGTLRLATATSAHPAGPMDWKVVDVDSAAVPCAGLCAKSDFCVSTDPKSRSKSVCKGPDATPCPMACTPMTQACLGGACVTPLVAAKVTDLVEGTGLFAQLMRTSMGARLVTYYDREASSLKLATESAPGTLTPAFVDGNTDTTDVGQYATAMVAPDGTVHVAYVDAIADRLLYRALPGGVLGAMPAPPEVIDDGLDMRMDQKHSVGAGAALWTDGKTVKVVYQDQRTADLWLATRTGNAWAKSALRAGSPGYGFYPHLVSDGGKVYLTEFVYDRAQPGKGNPLGAIEITALP